MISRVTRAANVQSESTLPRAAVQGLSSHQEHLGDQGVWDEDAEREKGALKIKLLIWSFYFI